MEPGLLATAKEFISVQAPSPIAARPPATPRSTFTRPPHSSHSVPSWPCASMRASAMAWMRLVFVVMSCSHVERPLRVASMARLRTPPKRPPPARLDSGRLHVGRTPHVAGRGTLRCRDWQSESRADAAPPTRAGRRCAVVRSVIGERRSSRKQAGRLRYDPQCSGDPSGVIREPAVPFAWRGSRTGAAEHALALEADWCLRRPSVGGPPRGDEATGKPNADNNLDALHRGWRGTRATFIAKRCSYGSNVASRCGTASVTGHERGACSSISNRRVAVCLRAGPAVQRGWEQ